MINIKLDSLFYFSWVQIDLIYIVKHARGFLQSIFVTVPGIRSIVKIYIAF